MLKITNNSNIPLALAVWLVNDDYDYIQGVENYISATKLMKPTKQIILASRIPQEEQTTDVEDFISRAMGHSFHDSIEHAWKNKYKQNLKKLGYSDHVINGVLINPTPEQLMTTENPIPVYLEYRSIRAINGYSIGGKLDTCIEGILHDYKSTSAYAWLKGTRDEDFVKQGSIYRWLNPEIVTHDFIRICFIFTDWQRAMANSNPAYPQKKLLFKDIPLWSLEKTEEYIKGRLTEITSSIHKDEKDIPECTDEELWRSEPVYKYYANVNNLTGRATKNFDNPNEAKQYQISKGGVGTIITVPGLVKRCGYCDAFQICQQARRYIEL